MKLFLLMLSILAIGVCSPSKNTHAPCVEAFLCLHGKHNKPTCGRASNNEIRRFLNPCDLKEYNCEYARVIVLMCCGVLMIKAHGPPKERDNEDISMGRKMGTKWCGMAKTCNHDRVPVCGISHAGDVMGFRDLCDMFDFNCIRRRNYKQTTCPQDKSILTVSRRPTNTYYDD